MHEIDKSVEINEKSLRWIGNDISVSIFSAVQKFGLFFFKRPKISQEACFIGHKL